MLIGMAACEMASLLNDAKARQELEHTALNTIRRALDQLLRTNLPNE